MKKKNTKTIPKRTQYLLLIRAYDPKYKEDRNEIFEFRSKKARDSMIRVCDQNNIKWAKSDAKSEE